MKTSHYFKKFISFLLVLIVLLSPFFIDSQDNIYPAIKVEDSSVGYYQSTTCNISLYNVLKNNYRNLEDIKINENNYAPLDCLGKVTGLDKTSSEYVVSIGTNSNYTLIFQGILWCSILLFFSNKYSTRNIRYGLVATLSAFFAVQHLSEERFYSRINQYFSSNLEIGNIYLLSIFFSYFIILLLISLIVENNEKNLLNKFPFMFLLVGTFNGFNLSIYILIFSYLGLKNLLVSKTLNSFNLTYSLFSILWLFTGREKNSFFDTDKLKGFINSSNNLSSLIFWTILYLLIFNCFIYLYKVSEINLSEISKNLLVSGTLITIFGIIGSTSKMLNFINYFIFGQNKRGINTLESIAGNTWRGFSASAESLGEFLGFGILFTFILLMKKMIFTDWKIIFFLIFPIYGLIRTNNSAVFILLTLIASYFLYQKLIINNKIILKKRNFLIASSMIIVLVSTYSIFNSFDYDYISKLLIYESALQSNFFSDMAVYGKWLYTTNYFENNQIYSLIILENLGNPSSSLVFITKIFHQNNFNIPYIPNFVGLLSFISLLINRSGLWAIFIAKYNPNGIEAFFGNGPSQFNNYLYKLKVNLFSYKEVPESLPTSLFLPHSSFLDIIVFYGFIGFSLFVIWNLYLLKTKTAENSPKILLIFILVNMIKSDSILYINSFTLLMFVYILILKNRENYGFKAK